MKNYAENEYQSNKGLGMYIMINVNNINSSIEND